MAKKKSHLQPNCIVNYEFAYSQAATMVATASVAFIGCYLMCQLDIVAPNS